MEMDWHFHQIIAAIQKLFPLHHMTMLHLHKTAQVSKLIREGETCFFKWLKCRMLTTNMHIPIITIYLSKYTRLVGQHSLQFKWSGTEADGGMATAHSSSDLTPSLVNNVHLFLMNIKTIACERSVLK